jgi:xanthine/CO dehydrogenase XdhC/CoxF family maturation factor
MSTKEHADIFALYRSLRATGGTGVLASVVRTTGSTYRRPGARMLVAGDGRSAGLISGGCLESDLRERSAEVLATGKPLLVRYDSTSREDVLWGLGLGCPGIAHVLLERVSGSEDCGVLEFIQECRRTRCAGAIASPFVLTGIAGETARSRVFLREGTLLKGGTADDALTAALGRACAGALSTQKSSQLTLSLPGGEAEAFIEYVPLPVPLFVFGAGPDAAPLVRMAKELGWHVTVVDSRGAYLTRESFPSADELVLARPEETRDLFAVPRGAVAVIMTHNFENDVALVRSLLASAAAYVGLLGPRAKAEMLLGRLAEEGIIPAEDDIARFHSPVGFDIGGETPEEIAVAIVAEILSTLHDRPGTPLRHREGPIHR